MTESRAELNAGLVDSMEHSAESPSCAAQGTTKATAEDEVDPRVHKSRRLANSANCKSPAEWRTLLGNSRSDFLSTSAVPGSPTEALLGGLLLTPGVDTCMGNVGRMGM